MTKKLSIHYAYKDFFITQVSNFRVIVPVSKVTFGFAAGGSEFNTNKMNKFSEDLKLPFGGGSGAGVKISPSAFLVISEGNVRLLTLDSNNPIDRILDLAPDLISKISGLIDKSMNKSPQVINIQNDDI